MLFAVIAVAGVILGIIGLKKQYKKLSIAVLVISGVFLAVIIYLAIGYLLQGV